MSMDREQWTRRAFQAAALGLTAGCRVGAREEVLKDGPRYGPGADLRGVQVFPADNAWNQDVSAAPVDPSSTAILARIGPDKPLHPDFGTVYQGAPNGIPYVAVAGTQPKVPLRFRTA